jgi:hypothetical protein
VSSAKTRTHLAGGVAAALLLSVLVLGCGSGGSGETTSAPTEAATPRPAGSGQAASPGGGGSKQAKPRYEGAEEEVEQLGSEAGGSEREAVVGVEQEYLTALSEQDFITVCGLLAKPTRMQLQQLVQGKKVGCATILPRLLGGPAASTAHIYLGGELRRVRLSGRKAFVIFHAPGARLFVIGLVNEDGRWLVGNLTPSVLAPSKAALEG